MDRAKLETIITENHLPASIEEVGRTWVRVELSDQHTGLSKTLSMAMTDFADLILHWRDHGCHVRPCPAMRAGPVHEEGEP
jgi:hypothetical protein